MYFCQIPAKSKSNEQPEEVITETVTLATSAKEEVTEEITSLDFEIEIKQNEIEGNEKFNKLFINIPL